MNPFTDLRLVGRKAKIVRAPAHTDVELQVSCMDVIVCVCVCVCARAREYVCMYVCMYVCLFVCYWSHIILDVCMYLSTYV